MPKFKAINEDQLKAHLAKRLRELRGDKSQDKVCAEADVAKRSYCLWEHGDQLPNLATLLRVANYYEVPLRELMP